MKSDFNFKTKNKVSISIFLISLALSIFSSFLTPSLILIALIPMAASSGLMAAFIYGERNSDKIYKFLLPTLAVLIDWLINGFTSLLGIIIVIVAFSVFLVYEQKWSKCESAFTIALLISLMLIISYIIICKQNGADLSVREFFDAKCNEIKDLYMNSVNEIYQGLEEELPLLTQDDVEYIMNYAVGILFSMIFVLAFVAAGISMKTFSAVLKRTGSEDVSAWRFKPSSVYVYFYVAVSLVLFFLDGSLSVFNLTVSNLNTIFMVVFAYVGWNASSILLLSGKRKSPLSKIILILAIVFVPSLAIQILSYIGAFYSIVINKAGNMPSPGSKLD